MTASPRSGDVHGWYSTGGLFKCCDCGELHIGRQAPVFVALVDQPRIVQFGGDDGLELAF